MFGFSFTDRVRKIVETKLSYPIPFHSNPVLTGVCKDAKAKGMNEHDAAIFFISVMMNSVSNPSGSDQARSFIDAKSQLALKIIPLSSAPREDIIAFLDTVRSKAGLPGLEAGINNKPEHQPVEDPDGDAVEGINALFRKMHEDPEEPEDVLEEISGFFVRCERKRRGFVNQVISGLYGALEGIGGYKGLNRFNTNQLEPLLEAAWRSRNHVTKAHEKAAILLFWSLLYARLQAELLDQEQRELEELGEEEDEELWKMEIKWRATESSIAMMIQGFENLPVRRGTL